MSDKVKMRALMSIPSLKAKPGAAIEVDAQTALDLEQAGRADRAADAKPAARVADKK